MTTKRGASAAAPTPASSSRDHGKDRNQLKKRIKRENGSRGGSANGDGVVGVDQLEPSRSSSPPSPSTTAPAEKTSSSPSSSSSSAAFWQAVARDPLAALVSPEPVDSFLSQIWEKKPAVFRAGEQGPRKALVAAAAAAAASASASAGQGGNGGGGGGGGSIFTKAALDALVEKSFAAAADADAEGDKGASDPAPSMEKAPPPPALLFGRDVCASRYRTRATAATTTSGGAGVVGAGTGVGGVRENLGGAFGERVSPPALRGLYESLGATLQVHQPQRWCDGCWRLVAALEARLGCLVGANSYFTPPGSRGLAPHWDDVEVFVLQVEGKKSWKVWTWDDDDDDDDDDGGDERKKGGSRGNKGAPLASTPSGDLDERELGEPSMRAVLEPGDVLYLPRGTIHAAAADVVVGSEEEGEEARQKKPRRGLSSSAPASASARGGNEKAPAALASHHITFSSHQRWSLGDLACAAISAAAAVPPACCGCSRAQDCSCCLLPRSLRPGLPPGFLSTAGFERGALAAAAAAAATATAPGDCLASKATASALARGLRDLADALEDNARKGTAAEEEEEEKTPPSHSRSLLLLDGAADALAADFFASRLPPHPSQLLLLPSSDASSASSASASPSTTATTGRAPRAAADAVAARGRSLFRLVACDAGAAAAVQAAANGGASNGVANGGAALSNGSGNGDGSGGRGGGGGSSSSSSSHVMILSCLRNVRASHLVPPLPPPPPSTASPSGSEDDGDEEEEEESSGSGGSSASNKKGSGSSSSGAEDEEDDESDDEDESDDDDDDESGDCPTLYPSSYSLALAQILASTPEKPVRVSEVCLPTTEAKLGLVYQLWSEGVVGVVE